MSHKTVEKLVARAEKRYEKSVKYNEDHPKGYPDYGYACTNKAGVEVWAVQIMDGEYTLRHYGTDLLTINGSATIENPHDISVSDQRGMNGFLDAIGAASDCYYVSRKGRTADYGGIKRRA